MNVQNLVVSAVPGKAKTEPGLDYIFIYKAVAVDPGSIGIDAVLRVAVTLTGALVGDAVIAVPPAALEAGLNALVPFVSAADTVQLPILNDTAAAIDGASRNWDFILIRKA